MTPMSSIRFNSAWTFGSNGIGILRGVVRLNCCYSCTKVNLIFSGHTTQSREYFWVCPLYVTMGPLRSRQLSQSLQASDRLSFPSVSDRGLPGRRLSPSRTSVHIWASLETLRDTLAHICKDRTTSFGFCTEAVYWLTCYKYWLGGLWRRRRNPECHAILVNYDVGFHGLCSLALTSPRKTSKVELEVFANTTSLTIFIRLLARRHFVKWPCLEHLWHRASLAGRVCLLCFWWCSYLSPWVICLSGI